MSNLVEKFVRDIEDLFAPYFKEKDDEISRLQTKLNDSISMIEAIKEALRIARTHSLSLQDRCEDLQTQATEAKQHQEYFEGKFTEKCQENLKLQARCEELVKNWGELDGLTYSFNSRERMEEIRAKALQEPK
jgi:chromosome segregation ATPase